MEYYRHAYQNSVRWDGVGSIEGKTVLVYCEQGYGDIIQFLRYIPLLQKRGCEVILHCPEPIRRLVASQGWGVDLYDKLDSNLPEHDVHVLSMSLPFLLDQMKPSGDPYLHIALKEDLPPGKNIGICWESGPSNPNRDCPLKYFGKLDGNLIGLQKEIRRIDLLEGCDDWDYLFGLTINDFFDTAKGINAVDYVVSVDTAILHLAGAMGKKTYALLSPDADARWEYNWYDSITLLKGDNWELLLDGVEG